MELLWFSEMDQNYGNNYCSFVTGDYFKNCL